MRSALTPCRSTERKRANCLPVGTPNNRTNQTKAWARMAIVCVCVFLSVCDCVFVLVFVFRNHVSGAHTLHKPSFRL